MPIHHIALDKHCVAALQLLRHPRLSADLCQFMGRFDVDLESIFAKIIGIALAAATLWILVERCFDRSGECRDRQSHKCRAARDTDDILDLRPSFQTERQTTRSTVIMPLI